VPINSRHLTLPSDGRGPILVVPGSIPPTLDSSLSLRHPQSFAVPPDCYRIEKKGCG